jgi:hypothetical protein
MNFWNPFKRATADEKQQKADVALAAREAEAITDRQQLLAEQEEARHAAMSESERQDMTADFYWRDRRLTKLEAGIHSAKQRLFKVPPGPEEAALIERRAEVAGKIRAISDQMKHATAYCSSDNASLAWDKYDLTDRHERAQAELAKSATAANKAAAAEAEATLNRFMDEAWRPAETKLANLRREYAEIDKQMEAILQKKLTGARP